MHQAGDADGRHYQQHGQQQTVHQPGVDAVVAEEGVFCMVVERYVAQHELAPGMVQGIQPPFYLGAYGVGRGAVPAQEDGIAEASQFAGGADGLRQSVFVGQGERRPHVGIGCLEDGADVAHHADHTDGQEVHQHLLAHGLPGTAEQLPGQAFADDHETAVYAIVAVLVDPVLAGRLFHGGPPGIVFGLGEGPTGYKVVAEDVEPVGSHPSGEGGVAVGRGGQGTHRLVQAAVPRQGVYARQSGEQGFEGEPAKSCRAIVFAAIGARDLAACAVVRLRRGSGATSAVRKS